MINIIFPNGIYPIRIIANLARKEFGNEIKNTDNFRTLKKDIIKALRNLNPSDLEENKLLTLVEIEHLNQNNFTEFISIRFAYYSMLIAAAIIIIGDVPIYQYFNMSKSNFGRMVIIIFTIILIITSNVIRYQHSRLEYLKFKLICFDELSENKKIINKRRTM